MLLTILCELSHDFTSKNDGALTKSVLDVHINFVLFKAVHRVEREVAEVHQPSNFKFSEKVIN